MPLRRGDVSRVAELSLSLTLLLFCDARCFFARRLAGRGFGAYWCRGSATVSFQERKSAAARASFFAVDCIRARAALKKAEWLTRIALLLHGTLLKHSRATKHCSLQQVRRLRPRAQPDDVTAVAAFIGGNDERLAPGQ